MNFDLTIIAIVFTLVLLLIFFSAVVLYLAFRVKETFRKETKRGSNIVKTAFLIGTLFLAGGIMYFSASTLANMHQNQTTPTVTPFPSFTSTPHPASPTPTGASTATATPHPTSTTSITPNPTAHPTSTSPPGIASFTVFFNPSQPGRTSPTTITISIINPSNINLHNAVVQTSNLFMYFASTDSRVDLSARTINLGEVPPGTTAYNIQLQATQVGQVDDTLSLIYLGLQTAITQPVSIHITGK